MRTLRRDNAKSSGQKVASKKQAFFVYYPACMHKDEVISSDTHEANIKTVTVTVHMSHNVMYKENVHVRYTLQAATLKGYVLLTHICTPFLCNTRLCHGVLAMTICVCHQYL